MNWILSIQNELIINEMTNLFILNINWITATQDKLIITEMWIDYSSENARRSASTNSASRARPRDSKEAHAHLGRICEPDDGQRQPGAVDECARELKWELASCDGGVSRVQRAGRCRTWWWGRALHDAPVVSLLHRVLSQHLPHWKPAQGRVQCRHVHPSAPHGLSMCRARHVGRGRRLACHLPWTHTDYQDFLQSIENYHFI